MGVVLRKKFLIFFGISWFFLVLVDLFINLDRLSFCFVNFFKVELVIF